MMSFSDKNSWSHRLPHITALGEHDSPIEIIVILANIMHGIAMKSVFRQILRKMNQVWILTGALQPTALYYGAGRIITKAHEEDAYIG